MTKFEGLLVPQAKRRRDLIQVNHVPKRALKTKGVEVVFNPAAHKSFITGFRKRKQQRRKDAQEQLQEKERQQRISVRAEKREQLKAELGLGDKWGDSSDESDQEEGMSGAGQPGKGSLPGAEVAVYAQQGLVTTVTTAPLSLHSESDRSSDNEDEQGPILAEQPAAPAKPGQRASGSKAAGRLNAKEGVQRRNKGSGAKKLSGKGVSKQRGKASPGAGKR